MTARKIEVPYNTVATPWPRRRGIVWLALAGAKGSGVGAAVEVDVTATIHVGDALEVLRTLPDESGQCCADFGPSVADRPPLETEDMRIRSIKPEFWKDEKVAQLPRDVRFLFVGLWYLADDYGRFRAHPSLVKGELLAYDTDDDVGAWLLELERCGFVELYEHQGQRFGFVRNFDRHQKIDRRAKSKLPPPPSALRPVPAEPANKAAEPADKLAEPADFTPEEQGCPDEGRAEGDLAEARAAKPSIVEFLHATNPTLATQLTRERLELAGEIARLRAALKANPEPPDITHD